MRTMLAAAALAAGLAAALLPRPGAAEPREPLGFGRLLTNDAIGDGEDRWRSGAYMFSQLRGPAWTGRLPETPGAVLELRLRADVLSPANIVSPDPPPFDRRYAGALSFGAATHFRRGPAEIAAGLDLVAVGPSTGIGNLHGWLHGLAGTPPPSDATLAAQIGDGLYPTLAAEVAWPLALGGGVRARPFAGAQAGVETFLRAGLDLMWGGFGRDALLLRDAASGQLVPGTRRSATGFGAVVGGDLAWVADSAFLPGGEGPAPADTRGRLRAGVEWQGSRSGVFYGLTWLGEEFAGQPEGQVVGSVRIDLRF